MEYIEMSAPPKGMFDKLISNDGSRVPFPTNGSAPTGFRPMPVPLFSHGKPLPSMGMAPAAPSGSGSDLSRRGGTPSLVTSGISLNGSHIALGNVVNGNLGTVHLQVPGESGSSQQGEEIAEKGKRSKGDGGRGNRGGGTCSRKRTRTVQADSLPMSDALPDGSLSGGGAASAGRPVIGNGTRQPQNSNQDKADKAMSRRNSGNSARRGDKKQTQMVATSVNDTPPPKVVEANGVPHSLSGILDIYGLRTRAMDVSRFMVDIPLNDLLSGNFEVPSFYLKDNHDTKVEVEDGFEQQIESVLHLLTKRPANGESRSLKTSDGSGTSFAKGSKNLKMMLDLEHPLRPEEEDAVPKVGKTDKEMQSDFTLEAGAGREGSTDVLGGGSPASPSRSKTFLDNTPVHSVEGFLSRLNLMPSDPLPSLIAQAGADGEMSAAVDIRAGSDIVDVCHRTGSVPPLLFSHPHVGPVKSDNGRYHPRIWMREISSLKGGNGFNGKEGSDGAGEDGSNSPSSRPGKIDSKYKVQSPDVTQRSNSRTSSMSPGDQMDPSRVLNTGDPNSAVKEEPRQVENAVALSSGNPIPMDIDSSRVDSGSVVGSAADATERVQAVPESERQRSGGEAMRPLETPETLARPQEIDTSSDCQGKPSAGTSPEVKGDEQKSAVKDPGEEGTRDTNMVSSGSLGLPVVDLKINIRSPPPPQIDSSPGSTGGPHSPGAVTGARILLSMANSTSLDQDKSEGEKERKRRVFQPYPGAPAQKTTKSVRVSNSAAVPGDGGREGRRSLDGGSVPPSKALVTERRKSLSQVTDASEKPSYSSPRNSSGGGIPTVSRGGTHTGSRSNTISIKLDKVTARESIKESTTSTKELAGRGSSSLPPIPHGGPPLKNGHKGVKTNSYLHPSTSKGSPTAAAVSKVPPPSTSQRVGNGGTSSRSSRGVHTGNSSGSHSGAPAPFKSSRQSIPESRQKLKSELPGRGGKPN